MEKRKTVYITAAAIAAVGGMAGALDIFLKHRRSKDAILIEETNQVSDFVAGALDAVRVNSTDGRIANADTIYASESDEFSQTDPSDQSDPGGARHLPAQIIRLVARQPERPTDT